MRVAPASHEAHTRRPSTKRPKNTALGPCRSKNGSPVASTCRRWPWNAPGPFEQPAPALAPDQVADVVADDRGRRRRARSRPRSASVALAGQHRGGDQRRLARDRQPADSRHHEQEQQRVAGHLDEVVDVEDRCEHRQCPSHPSPRRMAHRASPAAGATPAPAASYWVFSATSCFSAAALLLDVGVDDVAQHDLACEPGAREPRSRRRSPRAISSTTSTASSAPASPVRRPRRSGGRRGRRGGASAAPLAGPRGADGAACTVAPVAAPAPPTSTLVAWVAGPRARCAPGRPLGRDAAGAVVQRATHLAGRRRSGRAGRAPARSRPRRRARG